MQAVTHAWIECCWNILFWTAGAECRACGGKVRCGLHANPSCLSWLTPVSMCNQQFTVCAISLPTNHLQPLSLSFTQLCFLNALGKLFFSFVGYPFSISLCLYVFILSRFLNILLFSPSFIGESSYTLFSGNHCFPLLEISFFCLIFSFTQNYFQFF